MKILYKLFLLLSFLNCVLISQWYPQVSGTNYALKSVYFIDENTGLACGYNLVLKTTNAGANWTSVPLQGVHNYIEFVNSSTGFICSDSGKIFRTTNTGSNWQQLNSGVSFHLQSMSFLNSSTGIVCGYGKTILKTTDGGNSWFNIANFVWQVDFLSCKMFNANKYFVSGTNTFIMRTTNAGLNWTEYTHGDPNPLFTVYFLNENTGWSTGCCGMFMTTTNSGSSWNYEYYLSQGFTFYSIQFVNQTTGYVAGDNGMIYRTTNGALWWDSTVTGTIQALYSLKMINASTGWVVGGFGTILKTTNGGGPGFTIGINQISAEVPSEFALSQNYPNPFNPETKINMMIPRGGLTKVTIYDISGREIETLVKNYLNPGIYEIIFKGVNYSSGVYFYKAEYNNTVITKKMVLAK